MRTNPLFLQQSWSLLVKVCFLFVGEPLGLNESAANTDFNLAAYFPSLRHSYKNSYLASI